MQRARFIALRRRRRRRRRVRSRRRRRRVPLADARRRRLQLSRRLHRSIRARRAGVIARVRRLVNALFGDVERDRGAPDELWFGYEDG